jgi:hypothetical protein
VSCAAAAQVPSPLQNVLEEAEVPEFKLATGRLPVIPFVTSILSIAIFYSFFIFLLML